MAQTSWKRNRAPLQWIPKNYIVFCSLLKNRQRRKERWNMDKFSTVLDFYSPSSGNAFIVRAQEYNIPKQCVFGIHCWVTSTFSSSSFKNLKDCTTICLSLTDKVIVQLLSTYQEIAEERFIVQDGTFEQMQQSAFCLWKIFCWSQAS